ncbi:hypothetical protein HNV11_00660 [Spirosoma taeanense]|uniref:Capsule assembly Wzi family protein n=1 Tax=Spirosoma taeanense TaxID=2735870 RepID=A0A6M5Y2N2_9BACT|nr:hypothetical protein [Spirosoma taeanense]QJW87985.1 hypothetical protein HNV11_00660 [Spirosoma taeanense]
MRRFFYVFSFLVVSFSAWSQSPFIPLNADYYHLIDRLEIRQGRWADGFHSSVKPYNRQSVVQLTDSLLAAPGRDFSDTDYFNLSYLRDDSWEWVPSKADSLRPDPFTKHLLPAPGPGDSEKPFLKVFYRKKADFYSLQTPDVDLHVSPVIYFGIGAEQVSGQGEANTSSSHYPFVNTRGLEVRGTIGKKLGFYTFFADNQAVYPQYVNDYAQLYRRPISGVGFAPGEGFAKPFRQNGTDFLTARGYFTLNILKIINLQFGHDRNFFGNGFRSLLLSDNSAPYLFLKLTTRLGKKIQYTNLFTELQNTQDVKVGSSLFTQKFAAMHHLSVNITPQINLGVFEAEVFSRDRLDLNYLNPIIFYRFVESYRGSADNAMIGLDFKATLFTHFLFYSQFLLDEFLLKDLTGGKGAWTNKFAFQAGVKYIDVLDVPNLDVQAELNLARPYTYSHLTTPFVTAGQANYAHYSQPMTHPLGANFVEGLGIVRYQRKRLYANGIFGLMSFGADPPGRNYGGNILLNYDSRVRDEGNFIGQGRRTLVTYADLRASYMIRHNVFLEGRFLYRFKDSQYRPDSYIDNVASFALRWNLPYRNWVF